MVPSCTRQATMLQSADSPARRSLDTNRKSLEKRMNHPPGISAPEKGLSLGSSRCPVSRRPTLSSARSFPILSNAIHEILKPIARSVPCRTEPDVTLPFVQRQGGIRRARRRPPAALAAADRPAPFADVHQDRIGHPSVPRIGRRRAELSVIATTIRNHTSTSALSPLWRIASTISRAFAIAAVQLNPETRGPVEIRGQRSAWRQYFHRPGPLHGIAPRPQN
jgi:hypothetical protein